MPGNMVSDAHLVTKQMLVAEYCLTVDIHLVPVLQPLLVYVHTGIGVCANVARCHVLQPEIADAVGHIVKCTVNAAGTHGFRLRCLFWRIELLRSLLLVFFRRHSDDDLSLIEAHEFAQNLYGESFWLTRSNTNDLTFTNTYAQATALSRMHTYIVLYIHELNTRTAHNAHVCSSVCVAAII